MIPTTPSPATCSTEGCEGKHQAKGLCMNCYQKAHQKTPQRQAYLQNPKVKAKRKAYIKAYQQTPKRKAYIKAYRRAYYLKKKALSTPAQ